ncbi:MAG TPA: MauE/DoxX family redox-associated membrane protein [Jatrophihabitans sp.]|nr:MauE/DoxX family redox-associated membrane protein [Jatrophihabitans sp.]
MNVKWYAIRPWLGTVVRLVLGIVWIWASIAKLRAPRTFVQAVRAYDATPEWLSKAIGYGLPVLEICLGVLLIIGIAVRMAAAVSALLFVVFLIGLVQAWARGLQIECGCFGGGGATNNPSYWLDVLRDLGLLALSVYLVVWSVNRISVEEFLARNDHVPLPSAKRMRTDQGRRKYNAMLEARRQAARTRQMWLSGSIAAVIVLISLIGVGVQSGRAKIQGSLTAAHASVANGVVFGKKAAATVDVYEDFQCPNCLNFEKAVGTTLEADVRANRAQVRYHMISILDGSSNGNRYSSRAANAALCASDISVEDFVAYHSILYGTYQGKQVQPTEGSNGRTNNQLEAYASAAGIKGKDLTTFDQCVAGETHKALVAAITENASQHGINSTPTVMVNGKTIGNTLDALTKAIAAADAKGPAPDPSKTPTPSVSPSVSGSSSASASASASASSASASTRG